MLARFERLLQPTAPQAPEPPTSGLAHFYWHFARQVRWLIVALFCTGLLVAMLDATIPVFIGRVVSLVSTRTPQTLFAAAGWQLVGMGAVLLIARPLALLSQYIVTNQIINPAFTNMIRWQSHWHVVRQSWTFFQNDFAGRIANRVMQTGPALRESIVAGTNAVWYILVYGTSAIALLSASNWHLALPLLGWFVAYATLLRKFVPRMRERSRAVSEARSTLTGRVVDSYTNILTVKLFARARDEDGFVRESVQDHTNAMRRQTRMATGFTFTLAVINASMVVGTGAVAVLLWRAGRIPVGAVAMAMPMAWQIANMAGWVAQNVTTIFENVGVVQDGMRSIAVPRQMPDAPAARDLTRHPRRHPLRERAFRLWARPSHGRASRRRFHHRTGRARGPRRPFRRRQIHAGEPASSFLQPGERPDPGGWAGYCDGDSGKSASIHRHGYAGYQSAPSLDQRKHPLRPTRSDGCDDRGGRAQGGRARFHPGA